MKQLAIIGMGPRGLYALERLLLELSKQQLEIGLHIFDATHCPGTGTVWDMSQPDSNWINITERALVGIEQRQAISYAGCTIPEFPSYHEWSNYNQGVHAPDTFPPRQKIGHYLNARYTSIAKALENLKTFESYNEEIIDLKPKDERLEIIGHDQQWVCDALVLTVGHQSTVLSDQLQSWTSHVAKHHTPQLFDTSYPITQLETLKNEMEMTVGIRGFGLAMIDVMRYLTINNFGNFKVIDPSTFETVYYKTQAQGLKIVPFSLDGLPLVPKPLNEAIDVKYQPTDEELEHFKTEIEAVSQSDSAVSHLDFLIQPIAQISARVYLELKDDAQLHHLNHSELESVVIHWLKHENYRHHLLLDHKTEVYQQIKTYIGMALGDTSVSLDYCIDQVWRHCQPTLYKAFSHAKIDESIIKEVIALDERSKRYSYGPPIESMQQVLALVDADVLSLDYVNNPKITLTPKGWNLENNAKTTISCSAMVNSVLDAPQLLKVDTPLIKNLLEDDLIQPIHSALGIETTSEGFVKTPHKDDNLAIAVLGRLAKGSVIGVDAILECFGPRIETWAKAQVERLSSN